MEDPLPAVVFILLIVLIKGFFSLVEAAFLCSRKTWLRAKAEGGDKKYRKALEAAENPLRFLSALRIGIIFLGILAGAAGGLGLAQSLGDRLSALWNVWKELAPWSEYLATVLITGIITLVAVVLGDALPKQIAPAAPERILAGTLPFITILVFLCKPLIFLAADVSGLVINLFRIDKTASVGMTEDELRIALMEGEKSGIVESKERIMVEGVFYLGDRPVGTFMTHRSEITWLDINADPQMIRSAAVEQRNQRYFPVADGNLDEVIGVVSVQDILFALLDNQWAGLKFIMKAPSFVPETMSALKAFEAFKKGDADFLLVMDEYGGFAGVLSVRDLIEEIVGQLSAPIREENPILKQDDGTYLVDGNVNIDEIAEVLSLETLLGKPQEYHTLAGFILSLAGEIPRTGARFEHEGYGFTIVDMDGNRIDKVLIHPPGLR
ncbi:MAG: hemolysin family protein [Treponema sp.]|jgi:putative hemolysin|nr:hemolysin family protein [Treponema sp.]